MEKFKSVHEVDFRQRVELRSASNTAHRSPSV
jgi:hypothetical protein